MFRLSKQEFLDFLLDALCFADSCLKTELEEFYNSDTEIISSKLTQLLLQTREKFEVFPNLLTCLSVNYFGKDMSNEIFKMFDKFIEKRLKWVSAVRNYRN